MYVSYDLVKKSANIIDVRNELEYRDQNVTGSINVPRIKLLNSPDLYMNKNDKYYLLCSHGEVSASCSRILNALGYKCYSINGGTEEIFNKSTHIK